MKCYATISNDGFVVATCFSEIEQDGMVELLEPIGDAPSTWHKYHLETKQWIENKPIDALITEIKNQRNTLLTESDWTQIPNNPLTVEQQAAWATYRQELRDIPEQSGYPFNVVFPVAPI